MTNDIIEIAKQAGFEVHDMHGQPFITPAHAYRENLLHELTKFAELIQARAWQPIETAPKDGSTVIVGRDMGDFGFVRGYGYFEGKPSSFISGWVSRGFIDPPGELGLANPTHWMPLPTQPAAQKGSV